MSNHLEVVRSSDVYTPTNAREQFRREVLAGLSRPKKSIPSMFFYDAVGSDLFNRITHHPDYYLTDCENEILDSNKHILAECINTYDFNLIELGPGDGSKPKILIDAFVEDGMNPSYVPIDISADYLKKIIDDFNRQQPNLNVTAINADFLAGLRWLTISSEKRNVLLFFGSSIGNYTPEQSQAFLESVYELLHPGDCILIGFDLCKDIGKMVNAYNDSDGITRQFNLNLLHRINVELGGDFNLANFQHYEPFNVHTSAMESYLISLKRQTVTIKDLGMSFYFKEFEPLQVEFSHKYTVSQIHCLAEKSGFSVVRDFYDSKRYFVDSLWMK